MGWAHATATNGVGKGYNLPKADDPEATAYMYVRKDVNSISPITLEQKGLRSNFLVQDPFTISQEMYIRF